MAVGIRIKNVAGEIQIDENYYNLSSLQSDGCEFTYDPPYYGGRNVFAVSPEADSLLTPPPVILHRPTGDGFVAIDAVYDGRSWSPDKYWWQIHAVSEIGQTASFDWRRYGNAPDSGAGAYGLRVKNAAGGVVFDSNYAYLKVAAAHDITLASPSAYNDFPYTDITHPGISNPFYLLAPPNRYTKSAARWQSPLWYYRPYFLYVGLKKLSATSVRVGWFENGHDTQEYGNSTNWGINLPMKLLVCL